MEPTRKDFSGWGNSVVAEIVKKTKNGNNSHYKSNILTQGWKKDEAGDQPMDHFEYRNIDKMITALTRIVFLRWAILGLSFLILVFSIVLQY